MIKYCKVVLGFLGFGLMACCEGIEPGTFRLSLLGEPIQVQNDVVRWEGAEAEAGCGVILEFAAPIAIGSIVISTSPSGAPRQVAVFAWDSESADWLKVKEWEKNASNVELNVDSAPVEALKVTLYGHEVEMTGIRVREAGAGVLRMQNERLENPLILPFREFAAGASANIEFYWPELCWVGNPNVLNRNDRVTFTVDLSGLIAAGAVRRAVVAIPLTQEGSAAVDRIVLEYFTQEIPVLSNLELISRAVIPLDDMRVDARSSHPVWLQTDVTKQVNEALSRGDGSIGFRLRNATTEQFGNRRNLPEGVSVDRRLIRMEVVR